MRAVDREIKLIASGSSNYGANADWIGWNRTVLQTLRNEVDYIAIHTYIGNRENDFERFMAWSQTIDQYIDVTAALIKEVQVRQSEPRPIYVAYDEWNVWYRAGDKERLEEVYNFEDALAMGMFFNSFFRRADVVKMANLAQMVNVIAPIMTNKQGLFLQPTYFPLVEFTQTERKYVAACPGVSSPTYPIKTGRRCGTWTCRRPTTRKTRAGVSSTSRTAARTETSRPESRIRPDSSPRLRQSGS